MNKLILKDYQENPIHVYIYEPVGEIKAVVQIVHGVAEHFARYGVFAEFLNKHGYLVIGCDILGHGLSTNTLDYVHFADKNGDILAYESVLLVKEYIEKNYPEKDIFLLGHSMGSFIARKLIIDFPDSYKKALLSGTAYKPFLLTFFASFLINLIKVFKGPKYVSKLIQNLAIDSIPKQMRKDKIISGMDEEWLTRDEDIQKYYHNSKMCGQPITIEANLNMFHWLAFINKKKNIRMGNLQMPIYLMSGQNDGVSSYGKEVEKLYNVMHKIGYENIKMKLWKDCRHEILNELNKEEVFKEILDFFEE